MSYPTKAKRETCWNARDEYWKCLDSNNGESNLCQKFRELYEKNCPAVWVKHFDRKRKYEDFKATMDKNNWSFPDNENERWK